MAGAAGNWPLFGRIKRKGERRMEEALAGYIVFLKEQERSETTVNKYRHDIETFLAWNMHAPVTKERVISYKHWLTERYAPAMLLSLENTYNFIFGSVPLGRTIAFPPPSSRNSSTFAFGSPFKPME